MNEKKRISMRVEQNKGQQQESLRELVETVLTKDNHDEDSDAIAIVSNSSKNHSRTNSYDRSLSPTEGDLYINNFPTQLPSGKDGAGFVKKRSMRFDKAMLANVNNNSNSFTDSSENQQG